MRSGDGSRHDPDGEDVTVAMSEFICRWKVCKKGVDVAFYM